MKHFSNNCISENVKTSNFSSVVVEENEGCDLSISLDDLKTWSRFLLKISAASALTFTPCNKNYNSPNHHYSHIVRGKQGSLIRSNFIYEKSNASIEELDPDHEIAYETSLLEDLNPIQPSKSFKVRGRVVNMKKGSVSRV